MTAERDAEREAAVYVAGSFLAWLDERPRLDLDRDKIAYARALVATDEALREAEKQRDALLAAIQAEPPDDATVRYFQRLHGLPEVGLGDDATRLREAEAEVGRLREVLKEERHRAVNAETLLIRERRGQRTQA